MSPPDNKEEQTAPKPCEKYSPPNCGLPVIELCNKHSPPNCGKIKGKGALGNQYSNPKRMYYEGNDRKKLVETLQRMLIALGYDIGPSGVDGKFGDNTEIVVIQFQRDKRYNIDWKGKQLNDDGLVGPRTADALNRAIVGIMYDNYQTPKELMKGKLYFTVTSKFLSDENLSMDLHGRKEARVYIVGSVSGQIDPTGKIHFTLLTGMGLDVRPNREFILQGTDVNIKDQTDSNGEFRYAPAKFGDYELQVGDAAFIIPAILIDDPPYPVHIPYELLPDERDAWDGPTEEEIEGEDTVSDENEE